jgi:hypothetical protein
LLNRRHSSAGAGHSSRTRIGIGGVQFRGREAGGAIALVFAFVIAFAILPGAADRRARRRQRPPHEAWAWRVLPGTSPVGETPLTQIKDMKMKAKTLVCAGALVFTCCAVPLAQAQIAGVQPLGGSVEETNGLLHGWSVRKALVDEPVYNDANDNIGKIYDLIIAPDRKATYAVLSVGGFLGMGIHYVAIPIDRFDIRNGNLYLAGATKEALKNLPEFQYNKLEKATKPHKVSPQ